MSYKDLKNKAFDAFAGAMAGAVTAFGQTPESGVAMANYAQAKLSNKKPSQ